MNGPPFLSGSCLFGDLAGSLVALAMLVGMATSLPGQDSKPDEQRVFKRVGETELRLHIFYPEHQVPREPTPAIVFFFGGGWNSGSPSQFYPQCEYLASRGMVAMAAEYRVKSKHGTSPRECVEDGKSAVRWIRIHAAQLGVDPNRLAAGGGSAGGHVAAATGTIPGMEGDGEQLEVSSRPDALVLFNPVFDNGPGGYGHARVKSYWKEISPLHNVTDTTPPTIVLLGSQDQLVPVETAERFSERAQQAGVRCDVHLYEGEGHGFFNYQNRTPYRATMEEVDRFLESLGYLQGPPTLSGDADDP